MFYKKLYVLFLVYIFCVMTGSTVHAAQTPATQAECNTLYEYKTEKCPSVDGFFSTIGTSDCIEASQLQSFFESNSLPFCDAVGEGSYCPNVSKAEECIGYTGPCLSNNKQGHAFTRVACKSGKQNYTAGQIVYRRYAVCPELKWSEWELHKNECHFELRLNMLRECKPEVESVKSECGPERTGTIKETKYRLCPTLPFSDTIIDSSACECSKPTAETKTEVCEGDDFGEKISVREKNLDDCSWGEWRTESDNCLKDCDKAHRLKFEGHQFVCSKTVEDCVFQNLGDNQRGCSLENVDKKCALYTDLGTGGYLCGGQQAYAQRLYSCVNYCPNPECEVGAVETREEPCPVGQLGTQHFERVCKNNRRFSDWAIDPKKTGCEAIKTGF